MINNISNSELTNEPYKVLFISSLTFNDYATGGKTLLSAVDFLDPDNVHQLYFRQELPVTNFKCSYFRFSELDVTKTIFNRRNLNFNVIPVSSPVRKVEISNTKGKVIDAINALLRKNIGFARIVKAVLFRIGFNSALKPIDKWLSEFSPDIIYFSGAADLHPYLFLKYFAKRYNIPYIIYYTDDYFNYRTEPTLLSKGFRIFLLKLIRPIVSRADGLFVISNDMGNEYGSKFSKETCLLVNSISPISSKNVNFKSEFDKLITLRYFGFLHSNRIESIVLLSKQLTEIEKNYNKKFVIEVYTLSDVDSFKKKTRRLSNIYILPPVYNEEYRKKLLSADFLIHAESFDKRSQLITRLSYSTKINEYLTSKRCLIAVGPKSITSIKIITDNQLGLVLNDLNSVKKFKHNFVKVLEDVNLYNEYCNKAFQYFEENFSKSVNNKRVKLFTKSILKKYSLT